MKDEKKKRTGRTADKKNHDNEILPEERKTQDMSAVAEYNGEKSNRARLVEYEGDDYEDVPVKDNSVIGRTENFWYHHKWAVIFGVIAFIILFMGIYQLSTKKKPDHHVLYCGPEFISAAESEKIESALSEIAGEDLNGDKKTIVDLYNIRYLNAEQLAAAKAASAATGKSSGVTDQDNSTAYTQYGQLVSSGECGLMFLDESLFENLRDNGGLEPLRSATGEDPESAIDEYGIYIENIAAYELYPALQAIPGDTVVCLRAKATFNTKKSAEKYFESGRKMLSALLSVTSE